MLITLEQCSIIKNLLSSVVVVVVAIAVLLCKFATTQNCTTTKQFNTNLFENLQLQRQNGTKKRATKLQAMQKQKHTRIHALEQMALMANRITNITNVATLASAAVAVKCSRLLLLIGITEII